MGFGRIAPGTQTKEHMGSVVFGKAHERCSEAQRQRGNRRPDQGRQAARRQSGRRWDENEPERGGGSDHQEIKDRQASQRERNYAADVVLDSSGVHSRVKGAAGQRKGNPLG